MDEKTPEEWANSFTIADEYVTDLEEKLRDARIERSRCREGLLEAVTRYDLDGESYD